MRREVTNKIRFLLDELVPPFIRDSRWFMWPFFVAAYGRFSVIEIMNFKAKAYKMSAGEYYEFYSSLGNSLSRRRLTDLNQASVCFVVDNIRMRQKGLSSFLDVGAGNGYILQRLAEELPGNRFVGVDAVRTIPMESFEFRRGLLPDLPFEDNEFDFVTCTHVLEHVVDIDASVRELIRVARKAVAIVVPCQRYYFFTLDEHLNFFPSIAPLAHKFAAHNVHTAMLDGDWALFVDLVK